MMPACEVRSQFSTEQMRVAARQQEPYSLAQHSVGKQVPAFDILYLVEKKMSEVAIDAVQRLQEVVHVVYRQVIQVFIVKVDVCISYFSLLQSIETQSGFPASSHADNHLREITVHVYQLLFGTVTEIPLSQGIKFFLLVQ